MKPISAGKLRQRVSLFDVPESSGDSVGQPSQAGTNLGTFWAEVRQLRGAEMLNVRAVWPTASHLVTMRWLGSAISKTTSNPNGWILPRMKLQVQYDSSILNIVSADNVERRNRQWQLTCEQKVGAKT